jgi:hypothetical protein
MTPRWQGQSAPIVRRGALPTHGAACLLLFLAVVLLPALAGAATARRPLAAPDTPRQLDATLAGRDSLLQEIRRYREVIRALSDSLARDEPGSRLSPQQRVVIERNIGDISRAIEGIGGQLKKLEFTVKDNRISLVDGAGDGIVITVPEHLDEHMSQGLEALTQAILKELPDSASIGGSHSFNWDSFLPAPAPPAPPRRVIDGNLVRVGQALVVAADEDVRGNVVVVFGDCDVAGHVMGNVVTVGGALNLREDAEVTGSVVAVGGRLAAAGGARTGDTVALDWLDGGKGAGLGRVLGHRVVLFVVLQGLFLLTLLTALVAVALSPAARLDAVLARLRGEPARAFGLGAVLGLVAPAGLVVLSGLLIITVIGVPVAMLLALAVGIVVVLSLSATGIVVGQRVGARGHSPVIAVALGLCLLHLPAFVASLLNLLGAPLALVAPFFIAGMTTKVAALMFGLGALVLTRLGTRTTPARPVTAA